MKSFIVIGLVSTFAFLFCGFAVIGVLEVWHPGYVLVLKLDPRSDELDKAFALYEKETGKGKSNMSNTDIYNYMLKIRGQ